MNSNNENNPIDQRSVDDAVQAKENNDQHDQHEFKLKAFPTKKITNDYSAGTIGEWTLVYSDSNSSIFNDYDDNGSSWSSDSVDKVEDAINNQFQKELSLLEVEKSSKSPSINYNNGRRLSVETSSSSIIVLNDNLIRTIDLDGSEIEEHHYSTSEVVDSDSSSSHDEFEMNTDSLYVSEDHPTMTTTLEESSSSSIQYVKNQEPTKFVMLDHDNDNNKIEPNVNVIMNRFMLNHQQMMKKQQQQQTRNQRHQTRARRRATASGISKNDQYEKSSCNSSRKHYRRMASSSFSSSSTDHHMKFGNDWSINKNSRNDSRRLVLARSSLPPSVLKNFHGKQLIISNNDNYNTDRIRAYFHERNAVLNNKLTLVLILSLTAVLGLGFGHFLGWSDQQQPMPTVSSSINHDQTQIKRLQVENEHLRLKYQRIQMEQFENERENRAMINKLNQSMSEITEENEQLRQMLTQIVQQISDNKFEQTSTSHSEYPQYSFNGQANDEFFSFDEPSNDSTLLLKLYNQARQRVNQMMAENEDLKSKIARYRWTKEQSIEPQQKSQEPINQSNKSNEDSVEKQLNDQLRIRMHILHRQLMMAHEDNRLLSKLNQHFLKHNKRLRMQLKHRRMLWNDINANKTPEPEKLKSTTINDEGGDGSTSWDQQKLTQLMEHWSGLLQSKLQTGSEFFQSGMKQLLKSTAEHWSKLMENTGSFTTAQGNENLMDRLHEFFRVTEELLLGDQEPQIQNMFEQNMNNADLDKKRKSMLRKQEKRTKKLRKKIRKFTVEEEQQLLMDLLLKYYGTEAAEALVESFSNSNNALPTTNNDWLVKRAQNREELRSLNIEQQEQNNQQNWIWRRAKARQRSRIVEI